MEQDSQTDETSTVDEKPELSPEQSLKLAQLSLGLSQKAIDRCENRQKNEWKISLTIWATLFICTYFFVGSGYELFSPSITYSADQIWFMKLGLFLAIVIAPVVLHLVIQFWESFEYRAADLKMSLRVQVEAVKYMKLVDPTFSSGKFELIDLEEPSVTRSSGWFHILITAVIAYACYWVLCQPR